jgi:predicted lipid-binding transport protein (Tim44 family)
VEALIADPERRAGLARAARKRAAHFTPRRQVQALQAAYRSIAPAYTANESLHAS